MQEKDLSEKILEDYIMPIITLVLYFGEKHWNRKLNLRDLMQIPDSLKQLVNDIHINVYEIAWLTEEQLSKFKSDFGIVARFFVEKRKNKNYVLNDLQDIKHSDEVLKLLSVMTKDDRYVSIIQDGKGQVKNMCEVAERLEQMGREKGREAFIINMYKNSFTLAQIALAAQLEEGVILEILKNNGIECLGK